MSLEALVSLNELADANRVQAGQTLRIPAGAPWNAAEAAGWLHGGRSQAPQTAVPQAVAPPRMQASSRQSLEELLGDVWQRRDSITSQQDVYAPVTA